MDAIELLKRDHRKVDELFAKLSDGGWLTGMVRRLTGAGLSPRQRRATAEQICRELDLHAAIEESTFYPAVRALRDERLNELLDESLREHGSIKDRVQEARATLDDENALRTAMTSLQECVEHHVQEEENEMFPRVEQQMPEKERGDLGRALASRKRGRTTSRAARGGTRGRKKTTKRAAARGKSAASRRRVRKTTARAKKPRTATKQRARGARGR